MLNAAAYLLLQIKLDNKVKYTIIKLLPGNTVIALS